MFVKKFFLNFFTTVIGIFRIDIRYSHLGTIVLWEILEHDLRIKNSGRHFGTYNFATLSAFVIWLGKPAC